MSDAAPLPRFRLCDLGVGVKVGLTALMVVLLGGLVASAAHLKFHHENRDEEPGVSLNDIKGAYHGVEIPPPMLTALERGHPEGLAAGDRAVLTQWLKSSRVSEDYDNLDLGDRAPAEIIARDCVSCHKASAPDKRAAALPLDSFDRLKRLAFTRKLDPPPVKILAMSTHAHALSLATLSIVVGGLLLGTRLPRGMVNGACLLMGVALAADIASWWLARETMGYVYVIVVAGFVYNALTAVSLGVIALDVWIPRMRR